MPKKSRTSFHSVSLTALSMFALGCLASGCRNDDVDPGKTNEVITTVTLTLTPASGGTPIVASVDDPDGDGGDPQIIGALKLPAGMFDLSVKFANKLGTAAEDLTVEVKDESSDHQIFFTGSAVNGPASNQPTAPLTHAYNDTDTKGLPLGLANKMTAVSGTGMLTVTLRHLPPINNVAVKSASLSETVRTMGLSAIGGTTDAQVTFPVTVE